MNYRQNLWHKFVSVFRASVFLPYSPTRHFVV